MICPHCNRKIEIERQKMYIEKSFIINETIFIEKAFIKCTKCLQTIEITNNEPTKTIPKELTPKKILDALE